MMIPVSLEKQLMPGTLKFAIQTLVEDRMDMAIFEDRYQNNETAISRVSKVVTIGLLGVQGPFDGPGHAEVGFIHDQGHVLFPLVADSALPENGASSREANKGGKKGGHRYCPNCKKIMVALGVKDQLAYRYYRIAWGRSESRDSHCKQII